jgi:hypothetical protein
MSSGAFETIKEYPARVSRLADFFAFSDLLATLVPAIAVRMPLVHDSYRVCAIAAS